jgi:uncharacterized membrane protein
MLVTGLILFLGIHLLPTKLFAPTARHDAIAVAAGIGAALVVMGLHRVLFGVTVVPRASDR